MKWSGNNRLTVHDDYLCDDDDDNDDDSVAHY